MPERLERALKERARQLGYKPGSKRYQAYVYGTMKKIKEKKTNG